MSGEAVVYHDVLNLPSDAPYYTCDAQVRSEACVPIYSPDGAVLGIMDCEAFAPDTFRPPEALGTVLAACAQLGEMRLLAEVVVRQQPPSSSAAAPADDFMGDAGATVVHGLGEPIVATESIEDYNF